MDYSIEIHNLHKQYHNKEAVKGIDLCVKKREICAFLGPNGAGKSTTIQILSTLIAHDAGEVRIEGYLLGKQDDAIRKQLGVVFQESMLDDTLSVKQNLITRCGLYQLHAHQAKKRVCELAEQCQLTPFLHQQVKKLSGGERRKVDIARALIPKPQLLILDEPSTGLDPVARKALWSLIKRLHKEEAMTILLTTHYMEEAEIADHICMIQHGEMILDGDKETLTKTLAKDQLQLFTASVSQVAHVLDQRHVCYRKDTDSVIIDVSNFYQIMSILRVCERYIYRIAFKQRSIEDMYLELVKEERQ